MIIFISLLFGNYFKKFKINTKKFKDKNEFIEFVPIREVLLFKNVMDYLLKW